MSLFLPSSLSTFAASLDWSLCDTAPHELALSSSVASRRDRQPIDVRDRRHRGVRAEVRDRLVDCDADLSSHVDAAELLARGRATERPRDGLDVSAAARRFAAVSL